MNRRPQLTIVAPSASPEEAAAVVAALERFMREGAGRRGGGAAGRPLDARCAVGGRLARRRDAAGVGRPAPVGSLSAAAVIFDCDGVLVDSEVLAGPILAELLTELGLPTTQVDVDRDFKGRSWESGLVAIEAPLGAPPWPDLRERYRTKLFAAFDERLQPVAGIVAALDGLDAAGIPRCVASSGDHERIRRGCAPAGCSTASRTRRSSASMTSRTASRRRTCSCTRRSGWASTPRRTVVVEDSPAGVQAGVAAGMRVLGYAPTDADASALRAPAPSRSRRWRSCRSSWVSASDKKHKPTRDLLFLFVHEHDRAHRHQLTDGAESLSAEEVIARMVERFHPRLVLASSFQQEESVMIDLLMRVEPSARIFTLDTGVLFPETYATWKAMEQRYDVEIEAASGISLADQAAQFGDELWAREPDRCCAIRKVTPLGRRSAGSTAGSSASAATRPPRAPARRRSAGTTSTHLEGRPARRLERERRVALHPRERPPLQPPSRPRLRVDRLHALHRPGRRSQRTLGRQRQARVRVARLSPRVGDADTMGWPLVILFGFLVGILIGTTGVGGGSLSPASASAARASRRRCRRARCGLRSGSCCSPPAWRC